MNMVCVAGVANLSNSPNLQNMFFKISNNIFALILLLNICHIAFVICNVGHSCLTRSDETLFKNNERANFTNRRHNDQFSKFFLKDKITYNTSMHFLIYIKSASTVDHCTLLPYILRVSFERFTGKILIYFT